jgi:hypothetical protein
MCRIDGVRGDWGWRRALGWGGVTVGRLRAAEEDNSANADPYNHSCKQAFQLWHCPTSAEDGKPRITVSFSRIACLRNVRRVLVQVYQLEPRDCLLSCIHSNPVQSATQNVGRWNSRRPLSAFSRWINIPL